jgi:hypothetical protein
MPSVLTPDSHAVFSDVATLRSEHRICGVLSGTLPHLSQQNIFLGLPLILVPEELVLLLEKREFEREVLCF